MEGDMSKLKLVMHDATPLDSPGTWAEDATVHLQFEGNKHTAERLRVAINAALTQETP
jgi:hypothetical protein